MYEDYCKIRDSKGLKDADVSRGTGISKATLSDWKSGRSIPKLQKMQAIADFLDVELEKIAYDTNTKTWDIKESVEKESAMFDTKTDYYIENNRENSLIIEALKNKYTANKLKAYAEKLLELKRMEDDA